MRVSSGISSLAALSWPWRSATPVRFSYPAPLRAMKARRLCRRQADQCPEHLLCISGRFAAVTRGVAYAPLRVAMPTFLFPLGYSVGLSTSLTASTNAACFISYPSQGKSGNGSNLGGHCEGRVSRSPGPLPGACLILCHQPSNFCNLVTVLLCFF